MSHIDGFRRETYKEYLQREANRIKIRKLTPILILFLLSGMPVSAYYPVGVINGVNYYCVDTLDNCVYQPAADKNLYWDELPQNRAAAGKNLIFGLLMAALFGILALNYIIYKRTKR
jgi:hypothetical protein